MTIRSTQIGIAAICAIAIHTLDTKSLTRGTMRTVSRRTRRTAERHRQHHREASWPSVPDRLVAALSAYGRSPTAKSSRTRRAGS